MRKPLRFEPIVNRKLAIGNVRWSGREAEPTPRSPAVTVLPGMSHAPMPESEKGRNGDTVTNSSPASLGLPFSVSVFLVPEEGLKPSTSGL